MPTSVTTSNGIPKLVATYAENTKKAFQIADEVLKELEGSYRDFLEACPDSKKNWRNKIALSFLPTLSKPQYLRHNDEMLKQKFLECITAARLITPLNTSQSERTILELACYMFPDHSYRKEGGKLL